MSRRTQPSGQPATKAEHRVIREVNRSIVLNLIKSAGQISRVELARQTSLSKPTISGIVDHLIRGGVVREVGSGPSLPQGGRPPAILEYNEAVAAFVGIQFGVHATQAVVADGLGGVLVSVSASARRGNLGWANVDVRRMLERSLKVRTVVANTTAAAAWAEGRIGVARGFQNYVWIYTGTGIGSGIVLNGELFAGSRGFSGELGPSPVGAGNMLCGCGHRGCLETVASAGAVVKAARKLIAAGRSTRLAPRGLQAVDVATAAADGDALAVEVLTEAGTQLGRGIAYLLNILNPELVIIGGPMAGAGELYLDSIRSSVTRHALAAESVEIRSSSIARGAPLLGVIDMATTASTTGYRIVGGGGPPSLPRPRRRH